MVNIIERRLNHCKTPVYPSQQKLALGFVLVAYISIPPDFLYCKFAEELFRVDFIKRTHGLRPYPAVHLHTQGFLCKPDGYPYAGIYCKVKNCSCNLLTFNGLALYRFPEVFPVKLFHQRHEAFSVGPAIKQRPPFPVGPEVTAYACVGLAAPVAFNVGMPVSTFIAKHYFKCFVKVCHDYPSTTGGLPSRKCFTRFSLTRLPSPSKTFCVMVLTSPVL